GNSLIKASIFRDPIRSAHRATTSLFLLPASSSPAPKPERVSFCSVNVYFFMVFSSVIVRCLIIPQCFLQLSKGCCQLLIIGSCSVPLVGAHHKVNPISHVRLHQDHDRLALGGLGLGQFQSAHNIVHVVSVHLHHIPAKGFPLGLQVAQRHHLFGRPVDLLTIVVNGSDEVVHFVVSGIHGRFPYLAFLKLPVTHQNIDQTLVTVQLFGLGSSDGYRQSLAQ